MIAIEEAWAVMEVCNDKAHSLAWDTWVEADEAEEDDECELAEELREAASDEQAEYFQGELDDLARDVYDAIIHYAKTNDDFREQFRCYGGSVE